MIYTIGQVRWKLEGVSYTWSQNVMLMYTQRQTAFWPAYMKSLVSWAKSLMVLHFPVLLLWFNKQGVAYVTEHDVCKTVCEMNTWLNNLRTTEVKIANETTTSLQCICKEWWTIGSTQAWIKLSLASEVFPMQDQLHGTLYHIMFMK